MSTRKKKDIVTNITEKKIYIKINQLIRDKMN